MGRPYRLFSLLSGSTFGLLLRNSDVPKLVAAPRGFPHDIDTFLREFVAEHYSREDGDFGATWLSLPEILAIDWDGEFIVEHGYVEPDVASLFAGGNFPSTSDLAGAQVLEEHFLHGPPPPPHTAKVSWRTSLREWVHPETVDSFLNRLHQLRPPDEFRLIFWFNC